MSLSLARRRVLIVKPLVQPPPGAEENGAPGASAEAEVDLSMFDLSKKKKKKKKKTKTGGEDEEGGADGDDREEGEGRYNYETLLERIQVRSLVCVGDALTSFLSLFSVV